MACSDSDNPDNYAAWSAAAAEAEADYGFVRDFLLDPHRDPTGRWRETYARALGRFGAADQVALLTRLMNDDRSVLEVRYAAARALVDLGTPVEIRP